MKTVSVIMPIYNGEEYLSRSLEGLAAQTLQDMEYVLIDDCSSDGSYEIAKAFQESHPGQVVLLRTETNSGPGGARNLGLSKASGEFVGFVDCDDEIVPQMFRKLYERALETGADIVDSGYYNEKLDYAMLHVSDELAGVQDDEKRSRLIVSGGYMVSKIYRRDFLEKCGIKFREKVALEDSEFITKTFAMAEKVANVKEIFYKYVFTDYSASRERDWKRYYENVVGAMEANYQSVCDLPHYKGIQMAVEYLIVQLYSYGVLKCLTMCSEENRDEVLEYLHHIRALKEKTVRGIYEGNPFICQKISEEDIQIMKMNDEDADGLVAAILAGREG
jgi:Glycosyltransferases involved in cell wall biogenesis